VEGDTRGGDRGGGQFNISTNTSYTNSTVIVMHTTTQHTYGVTSQYSWYGSIVSSRDGGSVPLRLLCPSRAAGGLPTIFAACLAAANSTSGDCKASCCGSRWVLRLADAYFEHRAAMRTLATRPRRY
jgi:hypothetical protein